LTFRPAHERLSGTAEEFVVLLQGEVIVTSKAGWWAVPEFWTSRRRNAIVVQSIPGIFAETADGNNCVSEEGILVAGL